MTRRTGPGRPTIAQSRTRTGDQADRRIPNRRVAPNPAAQAPPLWLINNAFHPDGQARYLADHPRRTDSDITIRTDNHIGNPVPGGTQTSSQTLGQTLAILARLLKPCHRILVLRFLRSCSVPQAAAVMGVSIADAQVWQPPAIRQAGRPPNCGK